MKWFLSSTVVRHTTGRFIFWWSKWFLPGSLLKFLILVLLVLDYFLCFLKNTEHKTTITPTSYASFVVINMIYAYIVVLLMLLLVILFLLKLVSMVVLPNTICFLFIIIYYYLFCLIFLSKVCMVVFLSNPHTVLLNNYLLSCAYTEKRKKNSSPKEFSCDE